MRMSKLYFFTASAFVLGLMASPLYASDCFGKLRGSLESGKYGDILDCKQITPKISYIGSIHGDRYYKLFKMIYKTTPVMGGVAHGGEKLLVFNAGGEYLGGYRLSTPPFRDFHIRGTNIYINAPARYGNKIPTNRGFPAQIYLDGDMLYFSR